MLKIMRDTGGHARAVSEREIVEAQRLLARVEGIWTAPEAAADARRAAPDEGRPARWTPSARIVIVFTGAGIKNPPPPLPAPVHLEGDEAQVLARVRKALGLCARIAVDMTRPPSKFSAFRSRIGVQSTREAAIYERGSRAEISCGRSGVGVGLCLAGAGLGLSGCAAHHEGDIAPKSGRGWW